MPLRGAVDDGAVGPQRRPAAAHRVEHRVRADDVEVGVLLAGEAGERQVLGGRRGAHRHRRVRAEPGVRRRATAAATAGGTGAASSASRACARPARASVAVAVRRRRAPSKSIAAEAARPAGRPRWSRRSRAARASPARISSPRLAALPPTAGSMSASDGGQVEDEGGVSRQLTCAIETATRGRVSSVERSNACAPFSATAIPSCAFHHARALASVQRPSMPSHCSSRESAATLAGRRAGSLARQRRMIRSSPSGMAWVARRDGAGRRRAHVVDHHLHRAARLEDEPPGQQPVAPRSPARRCRPGRPPPRCRGRPRGACRPACP